MFMNRKNLRGINMKKNDFKYILGIIVIFIGTFLPAIRIAQENVSFLKDNGPFMIILVGIMFLLIKLEKKEFISIPSIMSVASIIKFIFDNGNRLNQINLMYNCYAKFQYGLVVIILGNLILLISLILEFVDFNCLNNKINEFKRKFSSFFKKSKEKVSVNKKLLTPALIEKISKKESRKKISSETTSDGKIKFNKITVKVDNKFKEKLSFSDRLSNLLLKLRLKRISRKRISLTHYHDVEAKKSIRYVPTISIQRWTRDNVSCINCGAKINSNSEYCFLCDCKINLQDKKKKLS